MTASNRPMVGAMQTIHTIGTQGMNDEAFIALLKSHAIDAVIDIRLHNEGRRYRFASGKHIRALCQAHGIAYLHESRFAPTEEMLKQYRQDEDWPAYEQAYHHLILERDMVIFWREVGGQFSRPCLLCAEKSPEFCHRTLLAKCLVRKIGGTVRHLSW